MVPRMFLGKAPEEAGPGCGSFAGTTQVEWKEKVLLYVNSTLRVLGKRPGHNLGIGWGKKNGDLGLFWDYFFSLWAKKALRAMSERGTACWRWEF